MLSHISAACNKYSSGDALLTSPELKVTVVFTLLHHAFEPAGIYVAKLIRILLVIAAAYKPAGREFIVRLNNHPSCVASYFTPSTVSMEAPCSVSTRLLSTRPTSFHEQPMLVSLV